MRTCWSRSRTTSSMWNQNHVWLLRHTNVSSEQRDVQTATWMNRALNFQPAGVSASLLTGLCFKNLLFTSSTFLGCFIFFCWDHVNQNAFLLAVELTMQWELWPTCRCLSVTLWIWPWYQSLARSTTSRPASSESFSCSSSFICFNCVSWKQEKRGKRGERQGKERGGMVEEENEI